MVRIATQIELQQNGSFQIVQSNAVLNGVGMGLTVGDLQLYIVSAQVIPDGWYKIEVDVEGDFQLYPSLNTHKPLDRLGLMQDLITCTGELDTTQ